MEETPAAGLFATKACWRPNTLCDIVRCRGPNPSREKRHIKTFALTGVVASLHTTHFRAIYRLSSGQRIGSFINASLSPPQSRDRKCRNPSTHHVSPYPSPAPLGAVAPARAHTPLHHTSPRRRSELGGVLGEFKTSWSSYSMKLF